MNPFTRSKRRRIARGESGQMAVFIALIFQVLFVFFAMVINVGLIVHDKINLQNAVDLGAYYAAQRQAEMLNEIAHLNYQIRQDYKLLAWRLRVLGNMGRPNHPASPNYSGPTGDTLVANPLIADYPQFCVVHPDWKEHREFAANPNENVCLQTPAVAIPNIPRLPVIIDTFGVNQRIASMFDSYRAAFGKGCDVRGPRNWLFGGRALFAFRRSVAARKAMVYAVSHNVSMPLEAGGQNVFRDLQVQSVYEGMRKTIEKNLTQANRTGGLNIEAVNGLAHPNCGIVDPAGYPQWLSEIHMDPYLVYLHYISSSGGCTPETRVMSNYPNHPAIDAGDPDRVVRMMADGEPPGNNPLRSSRGFEKNPWCMAYVGVRATSNPRKPFSPFGSPIQLSARSFAAPFGGRVGPWDRTGWSAVSRFSNSGDMTDPLVVPRTPPGTTVGDRQGRPEYVPNYSRYPGDKLGLKSASALATTKGPLAGAKALMGGTLTLAHYEHFNTIAQNGDPIAWSANTNARSPLGNAEIIAAAPDLFDITYYSVEPDYYGNFYYKSMPGQRERIDPGRLPNQFSDLGSHLGHPTQEKFSVQDQVALSAPVARDTAFWLIRDWRHVLTGWSQQGAVDFSFPSDFGRCGRSPDKNGGEPATLGNCIVGGRSGYSVRLVHREFLRFNSHRLGGTDGGTGPLLNQINFPGW